MVRFVKLLNNKIIEAQSAINMKKTGWSYNVLGINKCINQTKNEPQTFSSQPAIPERLCYVLKHSHEGSFALASAHFFEQVTVSQQ